MAQNRARTALLLVLLAVLGDLDGFAAVIDVLDDLREVRRAVELGRSQRVVICSDDAVNAVALGIDVVNVQSEYAISI